jgi:hypothetical protein
MVSNTAFKLAFVLLSLSLPGFTQLGFAQKSSTLVPPSLPGTFSPSQGGRMGTQAPSAQGASSLTAMPSDALGDWRNGQNASSSWIAPSLWPTSPNSFPVHSLRMAAGRPEEVVTPAARVTEHAAERVQPLPRIGEN